MRKLRLAVGYAAIAGTVPYLALKFTWLSGGDLGVVDPEVMTTPGTYFANAFTAGMDVVAIVVALAFTHDWGNRLPGWLVLFPAWVGTGFLAPIVLSAPVIGLDFALVERSDDVLAPWVLPVVYSSFIWQGCTLLTAFVLYARNRWPQAFTAGGRAARSGLLGGSGAALAVLTGVVLLGWAITGTGSPATRFVEGLVGVLALLAAVAVLARARAPRPTWWPLVAVWTGSAAMFSGGFWMVFTLAGFTASPGVGEVLVRCGQTLGGVLLAASLLSSARAVSGGTAFERVGHTMPQG
ncbi:hypothetical protein FHU38_004895 [Saccharomonospora amisosensis]|uniref:Uncharacterized protein n=1 Tax=Saccharomonospora amisosensis TaxID=1128677 RepID=A0A7X5UUH9_9PSEU|nr:hypothetical protein [Saccharomonospora amisosensis]NIJ14494.1 hypothetical protein [Saccharomonospora amisosensis]